MVDDMKGGKVMKSGKIMTLIFLFLTSLCIRADQLTWIDRARIVYEHENYGEFCFWAEKAQDKPLFVLNALAAVYLTGKGGVQTNSEKAVSFLNDAIKFWDKEGLSEEDRKILLESTVRLGDCYRRGIGVGKIDALKAEEMFKKAAAQNYPAAQFSLGELCEEKNDFSASIEWYKKVLDNQLSTDAQKEETNTKIVALEIKKKKKDEEDAHAAFVAKDWKTGFDIATNLTMNGISDSYVSYHVGYCYSPTYGTDYPKKKDFKEAYKWFRHTAELEERSGDGIVECILGDMELEGQGCTVNTDNAVAWYRRSAERKYSRGCYELGSCYEENIVPGVSDNLASATNWYFKAMSLGHGPAATNAYERVVKRIKEREVIALNRNVEKDFRERKSDKKKSEGVASAETTFTSKNESVWQGVWKGCKVLACSPGEILRFPVNHWGEITTAAVRKMDDDQIGILVFPIFAVDGAGCVIVGGVSFVGDCCLGLSDILSGGYLGNRFYYNKDSWGLTPVFQRKWEW